MGVNLLMYYFIKELRICASPNTERVYLKLFFLLSYSFSTFVSSLILPPTNYRANFRLELLIYNTIMLSYLLVYPTAYLSMVMLLYGFSLANLQYRFFIKKNSSAFRDALTRAINDQSNYEYLIDYNMREIINMSQRHQQPAANPPPENVQRAERVNVENNIVQEEEESEERASSQRT